jgi:cortical protein marker for cell polarity
MLTRQVRSYTTLPSLPGRGPLPPMVSVIVPLARTNLITNPSVELATTGYTAVGGSIARVATQQYHGAYSLEITPSAGTNSDGAFYGTVSLTSGTPYAYSLKFKATGTGIGKTYALSVATTGGIDLAATQFVATGRWQWIKGIYGETSTTTRRVYIRKVNHSAASAFYTDGWQVEACSDGVLDATTYIDGDQQGLLVGQQPAPYQWTGTPHASTSTRSALTRAGGYVVNLSFYNFLLASIVGLGMATPNNVSIPYTILDGARYQRTQKPARTLSLAGRFQADNIFELMQSQSDMRQVLDRDYNPIQQPLILQVEPQNECGDAIGDFANVQCLYAGGLEGNDGNYPAEDVAPTFTMYLPYLVGGAGGASLSVQTTVTNANAILMRSPQGVYSALTTGVSGGLVAAIVRARDGSYYVGGTFTSAGGVANTSNIARYDPATATWSALGTGSTGGVSALAIDSNDVLYAGGSFALMGGVANTVHIAKWNGSAWSALGTGEATGIGSGVFSLAVDNSNNLYAGHGSVLMGGVANTTGIAKWNGSAWSALSTGITGGTGSVSALVFGLDGYLYAGGNFTTAGGVAAASIAKWSGSAFSVLGAGITGGSANVFALAVGANNIIYAGGSYTTAGGIAVNSLAQWNGSAWSAVGSQLATTASVYRLFTSYQGIYISGVNISPVGGITTPDNVVIWNGTAYLPVDVDFPGTATVRALVQAPDGTLLFGYDTTGSATTAANTTVTNDTPTYIYPQLILVGSAAPSQVYQIINYTTGDASFYTGTINGGETYTITFDPTNPSIVSTFPTPTSGGLPPPANPLMPIPGSRPIYLAPGANIISLFTAGSAVTAALSWQKRYHGLADLVN